MGYAIMTTVRRNNSSYETNIRKFGGKLSALVRGSEEMDGIKKDRLMSGMVYIFDIGMFANEMIKKMWLTNVPSMNSLMIT